MHPRKRKPSTKAGQIKAALTRLSGRRVDSFGHPIALLTQSASNVYKVSGYFMAALDDRLLGSDCRRWVPTDVRTLTATKRLLGTAINAGPNGCAGGTEVIAFRDLLGATPQAVSSSPD